MANLYRKNLRTAVGNSAAPYGYTLATWTTGAVLTHARGTPDILDALMFMAGAIAGFAFVGILAFGGLTKSFEPEPHRAPIWESFHFLSVGLAIGSATLVANFVDVFVTWALAPFAATIAYLLVLGAQFTAAERSAQKRE